MKRLGRSKSGREMYGPKWQNMEVKTSETVNNDSVSIKTTDQIDAPTVAETNIENNDDQTQALEGGRESLKYLRESEREPPEMKGLGINRRGNLSDRHHSMYRACVEGDYVAAEMLLEVYPNLGCDEISEEGDRALHVAAAMKHRKLVQKLVERMRPSELALLDGLGYTACCYAAISAGSVEIADFMMRKNSTLATARDKENKTPLQKAASRGNANMVSYFMEYAKAKAEDLSTQEWFDLLLVTIRRNMYGVGLEILGINEQLATMSNDEGTALHLLAGQHFHKNELKSRSGRMKRDMRLLARKLWAGIQSLGQSSAVELMKKPPILHNAAAVGNVELITMLTHAYPNLVWLTDDKGYTIFHIAVKHRQESVFKLINEIGATEDVIAIWQDKNGNNILHLAGELGAAKMWRMPAFEMQREILWFEKVEKIVPPLCLEMKNKKGETAEELFAKEHKTLLEESGTGMRNASDSFMLVSTLILTMAFGATFAVPGGYDQESGIPVLLGTTNWFTGFIIFGLLTLLSSTISILCFLRIMASPMKDEDFRNYVPNFFILGVNSLRVAVLAAVSELVSAYFLVYAEHSAAFAPLLIKCIVIVVYVVFVFAVCALISFSCGVPNHLLWKRSRHTLFNRDCKRKCWVF